MRAEADLCASGEGEPAPALGYFESGAFADIWALSIW